MLRTDTDRIQRLLQDLNNAADTSGPWTVTRAKRWFESVTRSRHGGASQQTATSDETQTQRTAANDRQSQGRADAQNRLCAEVTAKMQELRRAQAQRPQQHRQTLVQPSNEQIPRIKGTVTKEKIEQYQALLSPQLDPILQAAVAAEDYLKTSTTASEEMNARTQPVVEQLMKAMVDTGKQVFKIAPKPLASSMAAPDSSHAQRVRRVLRNLLYQQHSHLPLEEVLSHDAARWLRTHENRVTPRATELHKRAQECSQYWREVRKVLKDWTKRVKHDNRSEARQQLHSDRKYQRDNYAHNPGKVMQEILDGPTVTPPLPFTAEQLERLQREKQELIDGEEQVEDTLLDDMRRAAHSAETTTHMSPPQHAAATVAIMKLATTEEVTSILMKLDINKATADQPLALIKYVGEKGARILAALYNCRLYSGCHGDWIKTLRTILTYKHSAAGEPQRPPTNPNSWREITMLPILATVISRMDCNRLSSFAAMTQAFPPELKGFVRGVNGTHEIIYMQMMAMQDAREQRRTLITVKLDISDAFNQMRTRILDGELKAHGVPELFRTMMVDSLTDMTTTIAASDKRTQAIRWSGRGIQGAPTIPILFNYYMARSIQEAQRLVQRQQLGYTIATPTQEAVLGLTGFADDTKLMAETIPHTQTQLDIMGASLHYLRLPTSAAKCQAIVPTALVQEAEATLRIDNKPLTVIPGNKPFTVLGLPLCLESEADAAAEELITKTITDAIARINNSKLRATHKLDAHRHIISRVEYLLQHVNMTLTRQKQLQYVVAWSLKKVVLHLPKNATQDYIHAKEAVGGLGVRMVGKVMEARKVVFAVNMIQHKDATLTALFRHQIRLTQSRHNIVTDALPRARGAGKFLNWNAGPTSRPIQTAGDKQRELAPVHNNDVVIVATALTRLGFEVKDEHDTLTVTKLGGEECTSTDVAEALKKENVKDTLTEWKKHDMEGEHADLYPNTVHISNAFLHARHGALSDYDVTQVIKGQLNILTTGVKLARYTGASQQPVSAMCPHCNTEPETQGHMLGGCTAAPVTAILVQRHNQMLRPITTALMKAQPDATLVLNDGNVRPDRIGNLCNWPNVQHWKPDAIMFNVAKKHLVVLEGAVTKDKGITEREQEKKAKYAPFVAALESDPTLAGWRINFAAIVIGQLGFVSESTLKAINNMEWMPHDTEKEKEASKKRMTTALQRASMNVQQFIGKLLKASMRRRRQRQRHGANGP